MEDAWQAQIASKWPNPSTAAQQTEPPQPPPPSQSSAPITLNSQHPQISIAAQQFYSGNHGAAPAHMVRNPLYFGSSIYGKAESRNTVLALLSGNLHHLSNLLGPSQVPVSAVTGPSSIKDNTAVKTSDAFQIMHVAPPPRFLKDDAHANSELHPFGSTTSPPVTNKRTAILHGDVQVSSSTRRDSTSARSHIFQGAQHNEKEFSMSSLSQGWVDAADRTNETRRRFNVGASDRIDEVSSMQLLSLPGQDSVFRAGPRVFCLNKVGELFLNGKGVLGVTCFCHSLAMTLAEFCEHSGLPLADPGDSLYMENGMTVAQWCKLCSGIRATYDGNQSGQASGYLEMAHSPVSKANPTPSVKEFGALQPVGISAEGWKCGGSLNRLMYSDHPHLESPESCSFGKLINSKGNAQQQINFDGHSLGSISSSSQQCPRPALTTNDSIKKVRGSPVMLSFDEVSHRSVNKGRQNTRSEPNNDLDFRGKMVDTSVKYHYSGLKFLPTQTYNAENRSHPNMQPDKVSASNVELRLGQPSQHNHAVPHSKFEAMHPLGTGSLHDSQKPKLHQHTQRALSSSNTREPNSGLPYALTQMSVDEAYNASFQLRKGIRASYHSGKDAMLLQHRSSSLCASDHPEQAECNGCGSKDSAISLFLSHLNYIDDNKPAQTTDNFFNDPEHLLSQELGDVCASSRNQKRDAVRNIYDAKVGEPFLDVHDPPDSPDISKRSGVVDSNSYNGVAQSCLSQEKAGVDSRICKTCTAGLSKDRLSSVNRKSSDIYESLHGACHSSRSEDISIELRDCCSHPVCTSGDLVPCVHARLCNHGSLASTNGSSTKTLNSSLSKSLLSCIRDTNAASDLLDQGLGCLPLENTYMGDMGGVSKLKFSSHANESIQKCGDICCLSATEQMKQASSCNCKPKVPHCTARSVGFCSDCQCLDGGRVTVSDKYYKYTATGEKIPFCSEECNHRPSSCHRLCSFKENLSRMSSKNAGCCIQNTLCKQKMQNSLFPGTCGCTVLSRCPTSHASGDGVCLGHNEPSIYHKENSITITIPYDNCRMLNEGKSVNLRECECLSKHAMLNKESNTAIWRDIPKKVLGCSNGACTEEPSQLINAPSDTLGQSYDKTCGEREHMKEQQMSNACSGLSAVALTEVSAEINKAGNRKYVLDAAVDEGSWVEKSGSSDEVIDSRTCEEVSVKTQIDAAGFSVKHKSKTSNRQKDKVLMKVAGDPRKKSSLVLQKGKAKGPKWKTLNSTMCLSVPTVSYSDPPNCIGYYPEAPIASTNEKPCRSPSDTLSTKRKRSASSEKSFHSERVKFHEKAIFDGANLSDDGCAPKVVKLSALEKLESASVVNGEVLLEQLNSNCISSEKPPKYVSLGLIKDAPEKNNGISTMKLKPIVCGNSGIIQDIPGDRCKPVKMLSMSIILRTARKCSFAERSIISPSKREHLDTIARRGNKLSLRKKYVDKNFNIGLRSGGHPDGLLMPGSSERYSIKSDGRPHEGILCSSHELEHLGSTSTPRNEEVRKRSISKLLGEDKFAVVPPCLSTFQEISNWEPKSKLKESSVGCGNDLVVDEPYIKKLSSNIRAPATRKKEVIRKPHQSRDFEQSPKEARRFRRVSRHNPSLFYSNAFCCVCGSSSKERGNQLLGCCNCYISVHQACYGVPKSPKGHWCCRPCKTNSKYIACVLCGYGGGAMTGAIKSRNIVKSLLRAWKFGIETQPVRSCFSPTDLTDGSAKPSFDGAEAGELGDNNLSAIASSTKSGDFCRDQWQRQSWKQDSVTSMQENLQSSIHPYNSITAGVLDLSVAQWVHMVCALWTPGTKCPNVDTMSTFDVSGASCAQKNIVCSICNRRGGSCIQCRVPTCSVYFHPWCAHEKGLLQSEVEGVENESVGFYGRCLFHATCNYLTIHDSYVDTEVGIQRHAGFSCARTEGYRGRKTEQGYMLKFEKPSSEGGGCMVSQDQINAWAHINSQKFRSRAIYKSVRSDVESDIRKEYMRYKQERGWKHLVVYKSGIHALGLYTSRFLPTGAMVVEYVGEIVGLRVADKREIEYETGRKMQYKSACYFFRIDKEHIVDATRKGGIARFVNHSCLPNCIAKIISIRNEKKVVFFAVRDINPGEEITYDYHFNHEDEGKKIPCFCNSKNCRRYLN